MLFSLRHVGDGRDVTRGRDVIDDVIGRTCLRINSRYEVNSHGRRYDVHSADRVDYCASSMYGSLVGSG